MDEQVYDQVNFPRASMGFFRVYAEKSHWSAKPKGL